MFAVGYLLCLASVCYGNYQKNFCDSHKFNRVIVNHHVNELSKECDVRESNETNEKVKAFVARLSEKQKVILDRFFRLIAKDYFSSCGYVLFGDKPLCIKGWPIGLETGALSGINTEHPLCVKWLKLWQDLKVSPENKKYLFVDFDVDYGYHHLICINREAFIQIVNDHLALFRYVLGPTLTAETLLKELIQAKERFYDVLKDDNVLLGILLGYGQQNALIVSREEMISDAFGKDCIEDFPFLAKKARFEQTKLPKVQSKRPSLGYDCLAHECRDLKILTSVSTRLKPFEFCAIPHFGCEPNSEETQKLLARYTANRSTIIGLLDSEDFLVEILKKLFTTTSNTLDIPNIPEERPLSQPKNRERLTSELVNLIHQEIHSEPYFQDSYLKAFLEGVRANHIGQSSISAFFEQLKCSAVFEMYETEQNLKRTKNLMKSDAYFNGLDSQKELIPLIPKKIYYKMIKHGEGPSLSSKTCEVSFHYTYRVVNEEDDRVEDFGTIKGESIELLIPGIALSLMGMQKGEEREIYLHPEFGYGENTYLPPNVTFVAKIELLEFSEGDTEAKLASSHTLVRHDYAELLKKYQTFRCKEFFGNGVLFWDTIKHASLVDFETFESCFNRPQKTEQISDGKENLDAFFLYLMDNEWTMGCYDVGRLTISSTSAASPSP
jgi:FKBP-type peptidyl-prolyl cis-trans isomerase